MDWGRFHYVFIQRTNWRLHNKPATNLSKCWTLSQFQFHVGGCNQLPSQFATEPGSSRDIRCRIRALLDPFEPGSFGHYFRPCLQSRKVHVSERESHPAEHRRVAWSSVSEILFLPLSIAD